MSGAVQGQSSSERMSWEQICTAYHGEWVLLVDLDLIDDIDFELRSAVVAAHGKHRRDTLGRVEELVPEQTEFAHFFIGKVGEAAD